MLEPTPTDPTDLYRNLDSTGHNTDDPLSHMNLLETAMLARSIKCEHCNVTCALLPMGGNGWGLAVRHQRHCPQHEDNQPDPQRDDDQGAGA